MRTSIFLCLAIFPFLPVSVHAQKDTAHHRAVYADINQSQGSYRHAKATLEEDPAEVTLEAWYDGTHLRKIVATIPGEHGIGIEEYYVEDGKPLFVYTKYDTLNTLTGEVEAVVEDRHYFKDGALFKWLATDKQPIPPGSADFSERAGIVNADFTRYARALGDSPRASGNSRNPVDGEIRGFGVLKKAEDGPYPMFVVTIGLKGGGETDYFLNVENPRINVDVEDLAKLEGKSVVYFYTSEMEKGVGDIRLGGKSLLGEYAPELDPAWEQVTGTLRGAEEESGDLPSEISVTEGAGKPVTFEMFVDPQIIAANGKTVTVYYDQRRTERITYLQEQPGGAPAAANPDVRGLIPDGFEILSYEDEAGAKGEELVFADLNEDGLTDAVALVVEPMEEEDQPMDGYARLLVFLGKDDGSVQLASQSGTIFMNSLYANPLVKVENRVISLLNRGKRGVDLNKYRYEAAHSDFMLIGNEYKTWDSFGSIEQVSTNFLTGERIYQSSRWDEKTEKDIAEPEKKETFKAELIPLSKSE